MELLLCVNLGDFASNVEFSKDFVDFIDLFFDVCENRRAVKGARDRCVPISAVFSEDVLILVEDKLIVVVAL